MPHPAKGEELKFQPVACTVQYDTMPVYCQFDAVSVVRYAVCGIPYSVFRICGVLWYCKVQVLKHFEPPNLDVFANHPLSAWPLDTWRRGLARHPPALVPVGILHCFWPSKPNPFRDLEMTIAKAKKIVRSC